MPDWKEIQNSLLSDKSEAVLPPSIKLPSLPQALSEFREKARNPDVDPGVLSRIIASDAGLSAELLRSVNRCRIATRVKITSVKQALVTMGLSATLLHLTTSGMKQMMKSAKSKLINFQAFWNTNLERALFAREVAKYFKADTELAYTAGMLQDFLLPLLTNQMLEDYLEFLENRNEYDSLVAFEQQKFGWDHAQAGAQIMHAWEFPPELVCCVFLHHRGIGILEDEELGRTTAAAVAISSLMPDALRQENQGMEKLIGLESEWKGFRLLPIAEKIEEEFQELTNSAANRFSFMRMYTNARKRMAFAGKQQ